MPNFSISNSTVGAKGPQGDKGTSGSSQTRSTINIQVTNFTNTK